MTKPDGVDYSFSRPTSPQALYDAGIRVASRYLSPPPNGKNLTAQEAAGLHAVGIGVLLNYESDSGRAKNGATYGTADGMTAAAYAESIGAPHGLTIYFSVDFDTTNSQYGAIEAYFRAVGAAMGSRYRVGVYGEADLIDYLHGRGVVSAEWQTYAWSNGRLSPEADFYQYMNGQVLAGAQVDFDRVLHPDQLGAWWPNGVAPAGGGTEINMTAEDLVQINSIVIGVFRSDEFKSIINSIVIGVLRGPEAQAIIAASAKTGVGAVGIDPSTLANTLAPLLNLQAPGTPNGGPSVSEITDAFKNALHSATFKSTETTNSTIEVAA